MNLNDILNDKEMNKYVNCIMNKAYTHYCCHKYYKFDDFRQEVYVYIIEVLPKYNSHLASVKSYLYSCIMNKALNLMRYKQCKQRGGDYVIVSGDSHYMESNGKSEPETLFNTISDNVCIEEEVIQNSFVFGSDLIEYLLDLHQGEKYYNTIITLLAEGYSRLTISKMFGKSRSVVDKRVAKLSQEIRDYKGW